MQPIFKNKTLLEIIEDYAEQNDGITGETMALPAKNTSPKSSMRKSTPNWSKPAKNLITRPFAKPLICGWMGYNETAACMSHRLRTTPTRVSTQTLLEHDAITPDTNYH
jgi:hypothetical protein